MLFTEWIELGCYITSPTFRNRNPLKAIVCNEIQCEHFVGAHSVFVTNLRNPDGGALSALFDNFQDLGRCPRETAKRFKG